MASTTKDHQVVDPLHQTLKDQELLPQKHLVDAGYIDTELLVTSGQNFQVDLIGPAPGDSHWQARAGKGFALADFNIDWQKEVVRCPKGKLSRTWKPKLNHYQQAVIHVSFSLI